MYKKAGSSYICICYGICQMLNIVINKKGIPEAVLNSTIEPIEEMDTMLLLTGKLPADFTLYREPGNAGKAPGLYKYHSGLSLMNDTIFIYCDKKSTPENDRIGSCKRIGAGGAE